MKNYNILSQNIYTTKQSIPNYSSKLNEKMERPICCLTLQKKNQSYVTRDLGPMSHFVLLLLPQA